MNISIMPAVIWTMSTENLTPIEKLVLCANLSDYDLKLIRPHQRDEILKISEENSDLNQIFKKLKVTIKTARVFYTPMKTIPNFWTFK